MLRRRYTAVSAPLRTCQACVLPSGRQWLQPAKGPLVTLEAGSRFAKASLSERAYPIWPIAAARPFSTSRPCSKAKRSQNDPKTSREARFSQTTPVHPRSPSPAPVRPGGTDPAEVMAAVDRVTKAFLAHPGIPSEQMALTALGACAAIDVKWAVDAQRHHREAGASEDELASSLLGLDGDDSQNQKPPVLRPQDVVDKVSEAAFAILAHPPVVITPQMLDEYVELQASLGRPQMLPQILNLFATKPKPKLADGSIRYVERSPSRIAVAIDPAVAETALDAAIEAKDLSSAISIFETTIATKAFLRAKLVKKALLPGCLVAATPVALFYLATQVGQMQYALHPTVARNMAFMGGLAYLLFTGTMGIVALTTANDHMKRVTWAKGTPLRHRWLYEDERAALDKIVCAFGFSEEHRFGEEEGEEFEFLREYILRRSMILDAVELMPGMN